MKYILLFVLLCCTGGAFAQDDSFKQPTEKSYAYHELRMKCAIPPYGLTKVRKLISTILDKDLGGDQGIRGISFKDWQGLSVSEKFTYCMINPENYSQNCDGMARADEEKNIWAYLPLGCREERLSDRQIYFLRDNKDSVIALVGTSIGRTGYIGLNYKEALVEANAVALIPQLIEIYNKTKKDGDILTVLNLLMKRNEYAPFIESSSYKKLYESEYYTACINYNQANEELIIKRATEFYQSTKK